MTISSWTQHDRLLRLTTPLGADKLLAESFTGIENLNGLCCLDITALSEDAHIELKTLIGQPVLLELQTAHSRTDFRPFHGHITRVEAVGANAGLARYRLRLEPWTAFLAFTQDSAIYQDMTVFDILEVIFTSYQGQGKLDPRWRFDLADRGVYPKRSLTCQYQESDADFMARLMAEEGLFSWIEPVGDAHSASLGSHTLVIADHNGAFQPNAQSEIAFAQPGTVIQEDRIDRWRVHYVTVPQTVSLQSWDYRSLSQRPVSAVSSEHFAGGLDYPSHVQESLGAYAYPTREQGQRVADRRQQALTAHQQRIVAEGTVRTVCPATLFTLQGHSHRSSQEPQLIWQVWHQAHNNLSADLQALVEQNLGLPQTGWALSGSDATLDVRMNPNRAGQTEAGDQRPQDHPPFSADREWYSLVQGTNNRHQLGERPLYRHRLFALPSALPYRNPHVDSYGHDLYPKPTVYGQQTAVVVGPPGEVIYTDRDHRIKVQFHWQRGEASHSRLTHPRSGHLCPKGFSGAPATDQSGTWVRVLANLAPTAGANWGGVVIPRIGQEVLIDFIEGDIDRPVVIASLYNGQGQANAPHNQVTQGAGRATGNAPPWFPGDSAGHAHPASLSGFKSQAMSQSQHGTGVYNQWVFDDSPGESRTSLQHHASAHQGSAELNLGHLRHQSDNERLNKVGFGVELKTPHSAALRAGQGLLISTDARTQATSHHLDSQEALAQHQQSQQLQQSLAQTAQQHNAKLLSEPLPKDLPAITQQAHSIEVLGATESGRSAQQADGPSTTGQGPDSGGSGQATAYSEPHLQFSSPAGIVASTPADAILSAGHTSSLTASHDLNVASQGIHHQLINNGMSLFTYGKADNASKPNTETGIKLHAATGKVSVQSQSDKTTLTADKTITVASTQQTVTIAAPQHLLMTAQGAYIKLEGGNIMIHGPGAMHFKASLKELAGPGTVPNELLILPSAQNSVQTHAIELNYHYDDLNPVVGAPYRVTLKTGQVITGKLDNKGFARIEGVPPGEYFVEYGEDQGRWEPPANEPPEWDNPKDRSEAQRLLADAKARRGFKEEN